MKTATLVLSGSAMLLACSVNLSCSNNSNKETATVKKDTAKKEVQKVVKPEPEVKYQRPPIINIVDTVGPKRTVVFIADSAATYERISMKLGKIYARLGDLVKKNKLKTTGAPLAWYKKFKAPYFFEAGFQVNKRPAKPAPGIQVREITAGKVVLAHFYGPYDLLPQGYDAIKEWIKDNKRKTTGTPYEIYVVDPIDKKGKPVDPYKVQTDIVFPIK